MIENILALPKPEVMTATEVANFLGKDVRPFISVRTNGNKSYIDKALLQLKQMAKRSEKSENKAYKALGSSSLEELQAKLDELNKTGLNNLSNKALQKLPAIQRTKDTMTIEAQDVYRDVELDFLNWVSNQFDKGKIKDEDYYDMIVPYFKSIGIKLKNSSGYALRRGKKGKILGLDFHSFTQEERKKIRKKYRTNATINDSFNWTNQDGMTEEFKIEIILNDNQEGSLEYYPYYKLDSKQRDTAKKDQALWLAFKKVVGRCVGSELSPEVEYVMDKIMGIESFINSGGSYADIVGIFGELQTLVFLHHFNITDISPRFLGHAINDKGQKIGIDAALESIGFQVKNYNTYGERGENEGINLRSEYKLKNFLDIITNNTPLTGMTDMLEKFYAVSAYHIAVSSDFYNIREWINHIQIDQLPQMYHSAISELLPIKKIAWVEDEVEQFGTNAFYIIGGTRILPVSKILRLYIQFLENIKQGLEKPNLITMGAKGGLSYSGTDTYKSYYEDPVGYTFPGYSAIADNITVRYRINLNIDYTIEGVLSKLKQEGIAF